MFGAIFWGFLLSFLVVKTFIIFSVAIKVAKKASIIVLSKSLKRISEEKEEIFNNFFHNEKVMINYVTNKFVRDFNDLTKNSNEVVHKELQKGFDKYMKDMIKVIASEVYIEEYNKIYSFQSSTAFEIGSKTFWKGIFSTNIWKLIDVEYLESAFIKAKKEMEE
jgi:hypothetical protein